MSLANLEKDRSKNNIAIDKFYDQKKDYDAKINMLEEEIVKTKQKLGDAFNAVMEFGGSELFDKITSTMSIREKNRDSR